MSKLKEVNCKSGFYFPKNKKCPNCKKMSVSPVCREMYYTETDIEHGHSKRVNYSNFWRCQECGRDFVEVKK